MEVPLCLTLKASVTLHLAYCSSLSRKGLISLDDICKMKCHLIDVQFVVYEKGLQDHAEDLYFQEYICN